MRNIRFNTGNGVAYRGNTSADESNNNHGDKVWWQSNWIQKRIKQKLAVIKTGRAPKSSITGNRRGEHSAAPIVQLLASRNCGVVGLIRTMWVAYSAVLKVVFGMNNSKINMRACLGIFQLYQIR